MLAFGNFALSNLAFLILEFSIWDFGNWDADLEFQTKLALTLKPKKARRLKIESDLNFRKELGRRKQNADLTLKPKNNMPT